MVHSRLTPLYHFRAIRLYINAAPPRAAKATRRLRRSTRSGFMRRPRAKHREIHLPFTHDQPRRPRPQQKFGSFRPRSTAGRPAPRVGPGSTRGRSFGVRIKRGRPAVDRTHGPIPGRFSESCCCAWRVHLACLTSARGRYPPWGKRRGCQGRLRLSCVTAQETGGNRRLNETFYGESCGFRSVSLI